MKDTQRLLMQTFCASVGVSLLMAALFEADLLPCGILKGSDAGGEFVAATLMELLTLCVIPVALRLFRFRRVADSLTTCGALRRWGMLRLLMLCVPMVVNTLLYYLYMNVAFGYMGIILLLCLAFVLPTRQRCESELRGGSAADGPDKGNANNQTIK